MNKVILTILLLTTVISLGSFGFFAMGHHDKDHSGCITSVVNNISCENSANGLQFATFHLGIFKSLTSGLVDSGLMIVFILFALVFGRLFVLFKNRYLGLFRQNNRNALRYKLEVFIVFLEYKLIRWLAIHENSPSGA